MNIVYQGKIALDCSTKIICTTTSMEISLIIINNIDNNYTLTISRFETSGGIHEVPIYKFDLDAGDTVRDTTIYTLSNGDYIHLQSTQPDTTYYISTEVL
jgi:hypothetical protein